MLRKEHYLYHPRINYTLMPSFHYFPRYSQKENQVTNNVLLLLARIRAASPLVLEQILNSLIDDSTASITVGPAFHQQRRDGNSVPDAHLSQAAWDIYVETKLGDNFDTDQINRHLESAKQSVHVSSYLFLLSQHATDVSTFTAQAEHVTLVSTTYAQLVEYSSAILEHADPYLSEIIEDFEAYVRALGLMPDHRTQLLAVPVSKSIELNARHGIYYQKLGKNYNQPFDYIGLYTQKCIRFVGRVVAHLDWLMGVGREELDLEHLTASQIDALDAIVAETTVYGLGQGLQYYFVDEFAQTAYQKTSPGGMAGHRYFDLEHVLGREVNDEGGLTIARALNGKDWT